MAFSASGVVIFQPLPRSYLLQSAWPATWPPRSQSTSASRWGAASAQSRYGVSDHSRKMPAFESSTFPAGTNADMRRNLQSGIELGTLGYQSPAVMAEQNVTNIKIIAGEQLGG